MARYARTIQDIRDKLDAGGFRYIDRGDDIGLDAQCPSHGGSKPNCKFRWYTDGETEEQRIGVKCWSRGKEQGCTFKAIMTALELAEEGVLTCTAEFKTATSKSSCNRKGGYVHMKGFDPETMVTKTVHRYEYVKYNGELFATKRRRHAFDEKTGERVLPTEKDFAWWPLARDWDAPQPPLFRGHQLVKGLKNFADGIGPWDDDRDVYLNEGEKAVMELLLKGYPAVCGHTGKNSLPTRADLGLLKRYTQTTGGAVVIVRDIDDSGQTFAANWWRELTRVGIRTRVVESATGEDKHDAADHFEAGFKVADLIDLTAEYCKTSISA